MSTPISHPIVVAELSTFDEHRIQFPLAFPSATSFADRQDSMLRNLQKALQKDVLDQGELLEAVRMAMPAEYTERTIAIDTVDARKQPLRESFHIFVATLPGGQCHSFVPALGIEIVSDRPDTVDEDVREHIRLEHMRAGRYADPKKLLACQWFQEARLRHFQIDVNVPGPDEQVRESAQTLLPEAALPLSGPDAPVAGLDAALHELTRKVEGRFGRSVLVVGADGSGKTSLLQAYAQQRAKRGLSKVWQTSAGRMVQALTRDGGWQKNLSMLCDELFKQEAILYVGHLSELFEVGQYEGNTVSIGAALREQLQRGRILLLAEATEAELAAIELQHAGFSALLQEMRMPQWNESEQRRVVQEAIAARGREHGVGVAADAVEETILLQRRYSPYSGFPGKPIRFLESLILQQKIRAAGVTREHALAAFCAETGIPQALLDARMPLDIDAMRAFFQRRIFGQPAALDLVCDTLLAIKASMARAGKPIASLLLIGPTGVGKTETAKALAEYMFGDAERMLRFDMSEYADPVSVLRLTGDLGCEEGTLVTRMRQQPFSVVLFDELEKAHSSFFDLLLQILGEGRLTGGKGQLANFCGAIIVMTSNIGATEMQRHPIGMHPDAGGSAGVIRHFEQAVQNHFRPELFNRLDHIVPYAPLNDEQRRPIIERELSLLRGREGLRERTLDLTLDDAVLGRLCKDVGSDRYGARQMQRVIQDELLFPLARILAGAPYARPMAIAVRTPQTGALQVEGGGTNASGNAARNAAAHAEADLVATQRRQLQSILAGPVWIDLINTRYMLQQQKLKMAQDEQRFWDEHGKVFNALNRLAADADALLFDILRGEGALLQATMRLDAEQGFDRAHWEQRHALFKKAVLAQSRPDGNRCTIGIYAPPAPAETLRDLYADIAGAAGYRQRVQTVRVERDEFRKQIQPPPANAKPDNAALVGYEIEFSGESAYFLFAGEGGYWRIFEEKRIVELFVTVSAQPLETHATPDSVHRKNFFEGRKVARMVKDGHLFDAKDEWQCAYPSRAALHPHMSARWQVLVDRILSGEA